MKLGNDFLFLSKYYDTAIRAHRRGDVVGMFLHTPVDQRRWLERLVRSNQCSQILIHLAPFDKTHRYPIKALKKQVLADAKFCNALAERSAAQIMISPFCENDHKAPEMRLLFNELRVVAPRCSLVNSIMKGQEVDGTITEIHIESSKNLPKVPRNQFTVSFDGCGTNGDGDMPDLDIDAILAKYSAAIHIRAWDFQYNGKYSHDDPTDINKRYNFPNQKYIKSRRALLDPREGGLTWKGKAIYKACADDHKEPDELTKDNRALCILPGVNKSALRVFDSKGKQIDTMSRFMPDNPEGPRYYSKLYAYEIAELAQKNTGSNLIRIENQPLTDGRKRSGRFK